MVDLVVPENLNDEHMLTEKYRPQTVKDCVLPKDLSKLFSGIVSAGEFNNMLLCGPAGSGKTTIAIAICKELDLDYYIINSSENGNIDTLRTTIRDFASSSSLMGDKTKVVILDEADYLNPQSTQPALRNFMEEFSANCRFILTCNWKNKLIEPLRSRCFVVEFAIPKAERAKLAYAMFGRCKSILDAENITYDEKALAAVVEKYFPDFRRILNELQRYGYGGHIDEGILSNLKDIEVESLMKSLKDKNFPGVKAWAVESLDNDVTEIYRGLYDTLYPRLTGESYASAVLIIADYLYKSAFVADTEVNLMACLTEIMCEAQWK